LPALRQQQDLLETLIFPVRETQNGEALVLAGQVAGDPGLDRSRETNADVVQLLMLSPHTVRNHISNRFTK
jgi:hypothetical protein